MSKSRVYDAVSLFWQKLKINPTWSINQRQVSRRNSSFDLGKQFDLNFEEKMSFYEIFITKNFIGGGTVEGPFLYPFFQGPFLHGFCSSIKAKKGHSRISEGKFTKISDYVFLCKKGSMQKTGL